MLGRLPEGCQLLARLMGKLRRVVKRSGWFVFMLLFLYLLLALCLEDAG